MLRTRMLQLNQRLYYGKLKLMRRYGCINLLGLEANASTLTLTHTNGKDFQNRNICMTEQNYTGRVFSTKSFGEDQPDQIVETFQETGSEFEGTYWAGSDDDLSHVRINLYPNNNDPLLSALFEVGTVQEILDIINSIPPENFNEKYSSQALVSSWDLQKILFRIGPSFDPVKDFTNRKGFIEKLRNHPIFSEKIVEHVVAHAEVLEDEPLAACLICLKRLDYSMRSPPCQVLIEECLKRKETFTLPAVSRLAVCMKSESTYGALLMVNFLPHFDLKKMTDDLSIRLISITLRSIQRLASTTMIQSYRTNIRNILQESELPLNLEVVTLCKILLCLLDTKGGAVAASLDTSPRVLIRQVGKLIAERSNEMTVLEILTLHRFLEIGPQEPMELIDTLFSRISTLIEEDKDTPRLDLVTCILPFVRNLGQRQQLASYVREYLDHYPQFEPVSHVLLKILKVVKINDTELYDKFWSKATKLLSQSREATANEPNESEVRRALRLAVDYSSFNHSLNFSYRHEDFENGMMDLLYSYLKNYEEEKQPTMIYPADFSRALAFLIAYGSPSDRIYTENNFLESLIQSRAHQFRVADLHLISRGIEASLFYQRDAKRNQPRYFNKIMELCTKIEDCVNDKLIEDARGEGESRLTTNECISISKIHLSIKRAFGDSPVFYEAVKRWTFRADIESMDSKLGREMATTLLCSNYNYPPVFKMLENFISENPSSVSPDLAEKFACLAYSIGHESDSPDQVENDQSNVFQLCQDSLEKHFTKLQPYGILQFALALCFYRTLQTSLVHNIFSVQFLDLVDEELATSVGYGTYPLRVRQAFMELNRAVCIDMPDSNVPWFHKNFCEDMLSANSPPEHYIHREVSLVLGEILNDPAFVKRAVYSPYFYLLDFLVEFDTKGRPIKSIQKKRSIFSRTTNDKPVDVGRKVAILVLPNRAFTRSQRSLKGFYKLRKRHLEILGYHVVEIDPQHWNSMFMSEPLAKNDFLENLVFSTNKTRTSKIEMS